MSSTLSSPEQLTQQLQTYAQRLEANPADTEAAFAMGELFLQYSSEPERAVAAFERVLENNPEHREARLLQAEAFRRAGQPLAGLRQLRWLLESNENDTEAYEALGPLLQEAGYAEEAMEAYQRAVNNGTRQAMTYIQYAGLLQANQKLDEAVDVLNQAQEKLAGEQLPMLLLLQGHLLERQKKEEAATQCYEKALAQVENPLELYRALASLYERQGQLVEAIAQWVEVLQRAPEQLDAYLNLAQLLLKQGRSGDALAVLEQGKTHAPDSVDLLSLLAQTYGDLGETDKALNAYEALEATAPDPALAFRKALSLPVIYPSAEQQQYQRERLELAFKTLTKVPLQLYSPVEQLGATPFYLAAQPGSLKATLQELSQAIQQALRRGRERFTEADSAAVKASCRANSTKRVGVFARNLSPATAYGQLFNGLFTKTEGVDYLRLAPISSELDEQETAWSAEPPVRLPVEAWEATLEKLRQLPLDVLLFSDVGAEPVSYFLAQERVAPKQLALWGHPVTSGSQHLDGFLAPEACLPPDAQEQFTEALIPLPGLGCAFTPGEGKPKLTAENYGLSYGQKMLSIPFAPYRWTPDWDGVVASHLSEDSDAHLFVQAGPEPRWQQILQQRLEATWPADLLTRLHWVGQLRPADWRQWIAVSHAVLVPPTWQEPVAILEALYNNVPLITRPGDTLRSNLAYGLRQAFEHRGEPVTLSDYL